LAESLRSGLSHGKSPPEYMVRNAVSIAKLPARRSGSSKC
jgi:hypothetical protein